MISHCEFIDSHSRTLYTTYMRDLPTIPVRTPGAPVEVSPRAGERMVVVGRGLAASGEALLNSLRSPVRTSSDLIKASGVNKDIASRFMAALAKRDPMAVVYYMPGVESLRRLSRGARSRAGDVAAIAAFDQAISAFEEFLKDELGGRHALDAMASAWLPEARERFEFASRQMSYRAMANLRGLECQTLINTGIVHPGSDPDRHDVTQIQGIVGLQRLRPSVPLMLTTFDHRDDTAGHPAMTLDGRPIQSDGAAHEFLPQFGRGGPPALRVTRNGSSSFFHLVDEGLGASAASDLFFGQSSRAMVRRWARSPGDISAFMEAIEVPSQRLALDVLLHKDIWPGIDPELMMYNTCVRGVALPYDRSRDNDRVDLLDNARFIGNGVDCCRIAEVPRYVELLEWACAQRQWNPSDFRVFRCDSRYPLFGVQYTMAFRLKERPVD